MSERSVADPHPGSRLNASEIEAIVAGRHAAPAQILGWHQYMLEGRSYVAVRAFRPQDAAVWVHRADIGTLQPALCLHAEGFFECVWREDTPEARPSYRVRLQGRDGSTTEIEDPYRFPPLLTDFDRHLLGEGRLLRSWRKLGAHPRNIEGIKGVNFAVWAPNALRVSVIGPFNGWDERVHPMQSQVGGVWELFIPQLVEGERYKYCILSRQHGYQIDKMDPYGFHCQTRPDTQSRIWKLDQYEWQDQVWLQQRAQRQTLGSPLNVYEVHLGSWKRNPADGQMLGYRQLAHELVAHCQRLGYTHVELLPIMEHPLDKSWGYQVTGYYAPSSRFGTPDDFRYFVDYCHQHGIGVLLDWVPAHFPKDGHGLSFFDGSHLYEHEDLRQREHREWDTRIFNFGRNEVRNFLISNALFWLEEYHVDGFRVDAVAAMLHLDFAREEGEWIPNEHGDNKNLEAVTFLQEFNRETHRAFPDILTVAEESTTWPLVTKPDYAGGLGFDLKWNMGWMHDTLDYFKLDPIARKHHQNLITFGLTYAYSENFMLAFSHDEVVHLKKSQLNKMPGDRWQQFANLRLLTVYHYGHPGKKLNFMGNEFAQDREWTEARSLDWHLLSEPWHGHFQRFVHTVAQLYLRLPALWLKDTLTEGFSWIDFSDRDNTVVSFARYGEYPSDTVVVVLNMTPMPRHDYCIGVPGLGPWHEILNSDAAEFGGSDLRNGTPMTANPEPMHGFDQSLTLALPPLGGLWLHPQPAPTLVHSDNQGFTFTTRKMSATP